MTDEKTPLSREVPVPSGRIGRFARMGGMATGIAGNMAVRAVGDLSRGERPQMRALFLTPGNLHKIAEELARMRGAAMKVGQLISMDGGDVLPKELADILSRLRNQAHFMPPAQLKNVLTSNWGDGWQKQFKQFDTRPIAAASIGQVHRATLRDGRIAAIKVQYPGVAKSIDSDVANMGTLLRLSGMLPSGFDVAPFLDEVKRQLHEETDYAREGGELVRFARWLENDTRFRVPELYSDLSTPEILAMEFVDGRPIEEEGVAQSMRDRIASALIDLTLREIFEFGSIQSDPNFANFQYIPKTEQILLLDFGAARDLEGAVLRRVRRLVEAGLGGDSETLQAEVAGLGLLTGDHDLDRRLLRMIDMVFGALGEGGEFDFAASDLLERLNREGQALGEAGYLPGDVPMDVLYLQRKVGGIFLLATRLGARVSVRRLIDQLVNSPIPKSAAC